jgi:pimeloyl-ACP methyl ester carboxylesterase
MECQIEYFQGSDGASIAAARGGSGPSLLIVPHMVSCIEAAWPLYAEAFPDYQVITYDRRGTGLSERDSTTVSGELYLGDAQTVADGFELGSFSVIGTLLGTIEAAFLAAENPDRTSQLVLRSPVTNLADWAAIPAVKAALAAMDQDWVFFSEAFCQLVVGWGKPNAPRMAAGMRALTTRDELRNTLKSLMQVNLEDLYGRIRARTLVEHHPGYFFPDTYSRKIASLISHCKLAIFVGADFVTDFSIAKAFLEKRTGSSGVVSGGFQTILFTDLVSSTTLTQELGDEGAQVQLRSHNEVVRKALREHSGVEIKHTGDGIMASFRSAVGAVAGALRMQGELRQQGIRARIGLNAGEPIAEQNDLFGSAVQLAARITDRAEAGTVLVSNVVKELCAGKGFRFESIGPVPLKGFEEPVELYTVSSGSTKGSP